MTGLIYKVEESSTKLRDLIFYLKNTHIDKLTLITSDSFLRLFFISIFSKIDFIHLFNPNKLEVQLIKLVNKIFKRRLIFSFETEEEYKKIAKLIKGMPILVENINAMEFFKNNPKYVAEVYLIRPYIDSAVFVASGARQLSFKKEILFLHDSNKNSKAHLAIEMLKYLPSEYFLTCADDSINEEYSLYLRDISRNLKVDSRAKIVNAIDYNFDEAINDLFIIVYTDKDLGKIDFSCLALSQGLIVLSNTSFNQEQINGWFRLESIAPKAVSKKILDLCEQFVEVDSKKALSLISKEAKAQQLLDFYLEL